MVPVNAFKRLDGYPKIAAASQAPFCMAQVMAVCRRTCGVTSGPVPAALTQFRNAFETRWIAAPSNSMTGVLAMLGHTSVEYEPEDGWAA